MNFSLNLKGEEITKQPFKSFCESRLNDPSNVRKLELMSYLIMPVQRIPRYRLLLQEILKNTPDDMSDKEEFESALSKIEEVANACDHSIAVREKTRKLLELQSNFGDSVKIFEVGRELVLEADLRRQARKGMKLYHFWLFNVRLTKTNLNLHYFSSA